MGGEACANPSKEQLARWLKQFPKADANGDGVLTLGEAKAYRAQVEGGGQDGSQPRRGPGLPARFEYNAQMFF